MNQKNPACACSTLQQLSLQKGECLFCTQFSASATREADHDWSRMSLENQATLVTTRLIEFANERMVYFGNFLR